MPRVVRSCRRKWLVLPPRTFGTLPLQYYAPDVAKVQKEGGKFPWRFFFKERCVSPIISRSLVIDEISIDSYLEPLKYHTCFDHLMHFGSLLFISWDEITANSMDTPGDPSQVVQRCADVMSWESKRRQAMPILQGAAIQSLRSILCYTPSKINNVPAEETADDI